MGDSPDITEMMRRAMQANARLYKGWMDLSLEYFRNVAEIFSGERAPTGSGEPVEPDAGVLVLEADEGAAARGAFLVTNDLGRTLTCELTASDFADRTGGRAPAQVKFDPPRLELAPGEQKVVQVTIPIDSTLSAGVAYSGEFSIKGLEGFSVPVVLRRTHRVDESTATRTQPTGSTTATKPTQPTGSTTATKTPQPTGPTTATKTTDPTPPRPSNKANKQDRVKRPNQGKRVAKQKE